jgi:tripartite-type tricarboxylate transporter receptor subunit TctC
VNPYLHRLLPVVMLATAGTMSVCSPARAQADNYPNHPIRLIVPFPPGGGNDNVARPIAQKVGQLLGQPIIIENKPGAGTTIGAEYTARSTADGYTLVIGSIGSHVLAPYLYKSLHYDPVKDFAPISLLATAPNILVVGKNSKFNTLAELVSAARAAPGKYTYASPGVGTPAHLAAEIFKTQAGINLLHVPYKGGANYLPDIIADRVDLVFDTTTSSVPMVKTGQTKGLAISRKTRMADLPNVPTFAEAGYPAYDTGSWYGVLAPAGTPRPVVDKLSAAFAQALQDPTISSYLKGLGADPVGSTPEQFADFLKNESAKYGKVIKDNAIKAE